MAKKAAKKATRKATKRTSKKLKAAPEEFAFVLLDGRQLRSVQELIDALETMSDETFEHHVNEMRNDFSNWLDDVFKEPSIAEEIKVINNQIELHAKLIKRLAKRL